MRDPFLLSTTFTTGFRRSSRYRKAVLPRSDRRPCDRDNSAAVLGLIDDARAEIAEIPIGVVEAFRHSDVLRSGTLILCHGLTRAREQWTRAFTSGKEDFLHAMLLITFHGGPKPGINNVFAYDAANSSLRSPTALTGPSTMQLAELRSMVIAPNGQLYVANGDKSTSNILCFAQPASGSSFNYLLTVIGPTD